MVKIKQNKMCLRKSSNIHGSVEESCTGIGEQSEGRRDVVMSDAAVDCSAEEETSIVLRAAAPTAIAKQTCQRGRIGLSVIVRHRMHRVLRRHKVQGMVGEQRHIVGVILR